MNPALEFSEFNALMIRHAVVHYGADVCCFNRLGWLAWCHFLVRTQPFNNGIPGIDVASMEVKTPTMHLPGI